MKAQSRENLEQARELLSSLETLPLDQVMPTIAKAQTLIDAALCELTMHPRSMRMWLDLLNTTFHAKSPTNPVQDMHHTLTFTQFIGIVLKTFYAGDTTPKPKIGPDANKDGGYWAKRHGI